MSSRPILQRSRALLDSFISSAAAFRIVHSQGSGIAQTRTLFILDSSFNPPHVAHLSLASSALRSAVGPEAPNAKRYPGPHRLLLLFSTHNADKQPAPAAFEQRLAMMMLFAEEVLKQHASDTKTLPQEQTSLHVDVGLTTEPFYTAKSTAIEESGAYDSKPRHIHLVGYDTFTRIFEPKYYQDFKPPLSALEPFFARHGLRITLRPEDKWGNANKQHEFWQAIASGQYEDVGGKREWADQIEVVDSEEAALGVSSTAIRNAAEGRDWERLSKLCTRMITGWIQEAGLYGSK